MDEETKLKYLNIKRTDKLMVTTIATTVFFLNLFSTFLSARIPPTYEIIVINIISNKYLAFQQA